MDSSYFCGHAYCNEEINVFSEEEIAFQICSQNSSQLEDVSSDEEIDLDIELSPWVRVYIFDNLIDLDDPDNIHHFAKTKGPKHAPAVYANPIDSNFHYHEFSKSNCKIYKC